MDLPAAVTAVVARATGSRPASWQRVVAGVTRTRSKWRIDLGSSTAFVKASANAVAAAAQMSGKRRSSSASRRPFMPVRVRLGCCRRVDGARCWRISARAQWPPPFPDGGRRIAPKPLPVVTAIPPPQGLESRGRRDVRTARTVQRIGQPIHGPVLPGNGWRSRRHGWRRRCRRLEAARVESACSRVTTWSHDVWAGDVCYADRGALLIDWPSATIGDQEDRSRATRALDPASGARPRWSTSRTRRVCGAPRRRERLSGRAARRCV